VSAQPLPPAPVYDPNYVNPVEDPSIFDSGEPELIAPIEPAA
jgi:hypothetical protein